MTTEDALAEMLGEDREDLDKEEMSTLRFYPIGYEKNRFDFEATHNVFPWLNERLSLDARMDKIFTRYSKRSSGSLADDMKDFAHLVAGKRGEVCSCYTGGCDNMLSRNLHFVTFARDCEEYAILQIERRDGRLSHAYVFTTSCDWSLYDCGRASIGAQDNGEPGQLLLEGGLVPIKMSRWATYNGCSWGWEGDFGDPKQYLDFEDYTITKDEALCGDRKHVFVDPDGVGYCPILGEPLSLWHM